MMPCAMRVGSVEGKKKVRQKAALTANIRRLGNAH
jgi:hypothetical protein